MSALPSAVDDGQELSRVRALRQWAARGLISLFQMALMPPYQLTMAWCARQLVERRSDPAESVPYVEPDRGFVNVALLLAVSEQMTKDYQTDFDRVQGELNSCLRCIEHEAINNQAMTLIASLTGSGMPFNDILNRVMANYMYFGMQAATAVQRAHAVNPNPSTKVEESANT